jgi:hypothetical protein
MGRTVEVPIEIFRKFARAAEALDEFRDAFEDFLISRNPKLLRELRKARREQLAGRTRPFAQFIAELNRTKQGSRSMSGRRNRPT